MPGVKYTVDVEVNGGQKVESASRAFEKTSESVQKISQRLKSMQQELYLMAEGGDKSSKAFIDMAKRAGDLKNAMGDTRAIVSYFADGERAVNGMNNAISATTSVVQGLYGTYSLLGGEANDKLLKNMVALESMNARLSNAYNLLKPDGKAMLYMNEMVKKGNIFAGAMSKAGGFVFKMIPAFKALSIASFLGEVTGVNDKLKDWITNADAFKGIMSSIGIDLPDNVGISQSGVLTNNQIRGILSNISSGVSPEEAIQNLSGSSQDKFRNQFSRLFTEKAKGDVEEYKKTKAEFDKLDSNLQKIIAEGKNPLQVDLETKAGLKSRLERTGWWMAAAEAYKTSIKPDNPTPPDKSDKSLKSTRNTGEKLTSAAPQTFNIYIDKLNEMTGTVVGGDYDLDTLGKKMSEIFRRMLVQVAAEQSVA